MTATARNSSRSIRIWILLLVVLAVFSFLAMRRGMGRAMQMKTETTTRPSSAELRPGQEAKVVMELTNVMAGANVEGILLEKQSEKDYRRTGGTMKVAFDTTTKIVMGQTFDLHTGTVVHITAKAGNDRVLRATQIVILTGYVKVR